MAFDKTQRAIVDSLHEKSQTIRELALSTGLSETAVRQNVKMLVHSRELEPDKARQPYVYHIHPQSNEASVRSKIEKVKSQLYSNSDDVNGFVLRIRSLKKETWIDAADSMEIIAKAIRELEADGQLIDTLESA